MPAGGGNPWRLTDRIDASGDIPVFTGDGRLIVFSRYRGGQDGSRVADLWSVPVSGGPARLFLSEASGAGFSPDGKWVAYTKHFPDRAPLWISAVDHLEEHREASDRGFVPRWSPDGRWLTYTTSDPEGGLGDLWLAGSSLSERRQLTAEPQQMYGIAWMRDSRAFIFASSRTGPFLLWRAEISGEPPSVLIPGLGDYSSPSVSPDGRALAFCHAEPLRNLITSLGPASAAVQTLTQEEHQFWPRLSPSGEQVVSVLRREGSPDSLYLIELGTSKRSPVGDRPAQYPSWLDDARVGYLSYDQGRGETDVRCLEIHTRRDLSWTRFGGEAAWLAVHPDGKRLAVVVKAPGGSQRIVLRSLEGSPDRTLVEGAEYEALRWVPDGKALSWSGRERSADPRSNGIWVLEPRANEPRRLLPDGYGPLWTADGSGVYFSRIGEDSGLWRLDVRSGETTKVRSWRRAPYFDIVGQRLVFAQDSGRGQIYSMPLR